MIEWFEVAVGVIQRNGEELEHNAASVRFQDRTLQGSVDMMDSSYSLGIPILLQKLCGSLKTECHTKLPEVSVFSGSPV